MELLRVNALKVITETLNWVANPSVWQIMIAHYRKRAFLKNVKIRAPESAELMLNVR